uniref:Uncharacterized protein n=1 Tax=Guillardia theta TaxID=55529 RepID=A0A6U5Z674_GUITH
MGKYDLTQEEIVGILDILRIVVIPNIEGRMKTIKRIISEIKTSGVQEYKEYFDSPSRDLFFYENELEKRSIQLEASSKDIVILSRKLIEGKKNHADDTQRAKKLTTSLYHSASRSKLDSPSNKTKANAFDAEKVLSLLQSKKPSDKLVGIQAINHQLLVNWDSARIELFLQELFSCLSNVNSMVRKSSLDLIPDLFHNIPVIIRAYEEDQTLSQEEKTIIEQNILDQKILSKCLQSVDHHGLEMKQTLISLLGNIVWSKDLESLSRMHSFLEDPSPYVRKTTIISLAKIVFPEGCTETFHRTAQLQYDKEWLVRVELCTSLPKMAGLVADDSCKAAVKRSMEDDEDEEGFGMSHSYNVFEMDLDVAKSSPSVKSERTMKVRMYHPDKIDKDKMKKSLLDIIVRMLDDDSWNVRRAAVKVFATFAHKGKKTTETLFPLCEDPKLQVCKTTFECIPRTISQKTSEYNETVLALLTILVSNMKDSRSKDLKDLIVEKRKAEISDFALTCILQVAKKDNALVINEFVRILETNHNPVMIISVLEVWPKLISPSDNLNAMRPVLNLLCSNEEVVRKQVATICPMLLSNPPSSDIVSFLVVFLSHENISVRKAAIAVLQDISGLNGEELKSRRAQLQKIAFGSKETIEVLSGEGRLISDGLNEEEERMLSRHGNDFVAKGLVCEMIKGTSGLESSHWKRRILLLNQYGEVWLASMNHLLDPIQIIARNSDIVVTKLQFGSLFQSALRIDVADGNQTETYNLGFITREEFVAWLCDFIEIEKKNSRSNVRKRKDEHRRVDYNMTKYEENYYGKTEMALDQFITELMTPKLTSIGDRQSSDRMRILVERLNNLVTDKELFFRFADDSQRLNDRNLRNQNTITNFESAKMSITELIRMLKHFDLFGTYFSPKQVSEAWKIANSGEGPSEDHDNLQMDWEEFQVCIKTLGKQAGIDVQSEEDERFKNLQKYQITEVKNLLLQHWNDFQLFARYCAGYHGSEGD